MRAWLILGILVAWRTASADCAIPQWLGTASGTVVPVSGSLYIYDESLRWQQSRNELQPLVDISWAGKPGITTYSRTGDAVVRLDYTGFADTTLMINMRSRDETLYYKLDPRWRPATRKPHVLTMWHHVSAWTCSWSDSVMIQLDQRAAAVRARWTYQGTTREWIVPPRAERSKVVVELGKIDCGTATIPPEELKRGGKLELFAIRFDGSEVPIVGLPSVVSTADMPDDPLGMDGALTLVAMEDATASVAPRKPMPRWIPIAALMLLGGAVIVGWWLARRSGNGASSALR